MLLTVFAMAASFSVDDAIRLAIWALIVVAWVLGGLLLLTRDRTAGFGDGDTSSLVERFGLFNIIVLGEVVIGVVDGKTMQVTVTRRRSHLEWSPDPTLRGPSMLVASWMPAIPPPRLDSKARLSSGATIRPISSGTTDSSSFNDEN